MEKQLQINEGKQRHLKIASKWTNIIAVFGFLITGFAILGGILWGLGTILSLIFSTPENERSVMTSRVEDLFLSILLFIFAAICFFLASHLKKFTLSVNKALVNNDLDLLMVCSEKLKLYYRIIRNLIVFAFILYMMCVS